MFFVRMQQSLLFDKFSLVNIVEIMLGPCFLRHCAEFEKKKKFMKFASWLC